MRPAPRSRVSRVAGAVVGAALLASCAQVPRDGPVVEVRVPRGITPQGLYNNPKGPEAGESPSAIVSGFLVAMTATPLQISTAKKFLTSDAQGQWHPQRVLTYGNRSTPSGARDVVVRLHAPDQVGARGQWQGPVPRSGRRLHFPMVRENGEWRIARVPDALIVPRTFYDQQYQEAEVYFFDPSGRILVPEPVHVPEGSQLASALVRSLVRGPGPALDGVVRSFLPLGLSPVVSVPVTAGGVAEVSLNGADPGPLSRTTTQLILAQLAWTLGQDTSINSFRLSIAGHQIADTAGAQTFRSGGGPNDPLDPAVSRATSQYYALRAGRLVSGQINRPTPVDGPFGTEARGIRTFAVSLHGRRVAGVTSDQLLLGPVNAVETSRGLQAATAVLDGPGLLRPAWDFAGRLWEIQDTATGARVVYLDHRGPHVVPVPGVSHQDVSRFLVSRDASRLVAVLRGASADRIVVSRIRYDADANAVRGTRARHIPWVSNGSSRVRDIGWTSSTTIEVLDRISPSQSEARILNVDGSTAADEAAATTISGRVTGLVTSPVGFPETPYAMLPHSLVSLASVDVSPTTIDIPGLRHITYAG
jgi:hypothetical protein